MDELTTQQRKAVFIHKLVTSNRYFTDEERIWLTELENLYAIEVQRDLFGSSFGLNLGAIPETWSLSD